MLLNGREVGRAVMCSFDLAFNQTKTYMSLRIVPIIDILYQLQVPVYALCCCIRYISREAKTNVYWLCASICVSVCLSVCLSLASLPHYCTDPDVTWGNGRECPLVVQYWADLQLVHGFRCCDRNPNPKCQRVLVLALCLVVFSSGSISISRKVVKRL